MKHLGRKLLLPVAAVALAGGSFAFLASNTFNGQDSAGQGTDVVAGYHVSNVHYTYLTDEQGDAADTINSVTFDLNKQATQVSAAITAGYTFHYNSCTEKADSYTWTCVSGRPVRSGLAQQPPPLSAARR